jgi:putative (di)nucleoside polyphosphate hydrolase
MTGHAIPKREALPYRSNVGIMLLDRAGRVFAGRRIDMSVESWQMPQGGIDAGEVPLAAAWREMKEEIGTDKASLLREHPNWLTYDLPDHLVGVALHGKYRGQKQKWLAFRFTGADTDVDLATPEPEFAEWQWMAADKLMQAIVPFKRAVYTEVFAAFKDLL